MNNIFYNHDLIDHDNDNYRGYYSSIDNKTKSFGEVKQVKIKKGNLLAKPQTVVTLQFKVKCLKSSLRKKLEDASYEVNQIWNYCNATSSKAIERNKWLTSFDLNKLMTGITYHEKKNPHGLKILPASIAGIISNEYVIRRNQFKKKQLRFRKSFGKGKTYGWVPFKEENINITYPYTYIQRTIKEKEILDKKTGEITLQVSEKEKLITKNLRVAGKNTPPQNLHALYSMENDSSDPYGLPTQLGVPYIKILGTHIKVFNHEYLNYYLYHLGARVIAGSFKEDANKDWFLNLTVTMDEDIYQDKHLFGKLAIPKIAPSEMLGLDPGTNGFVDNEGMVYTTSGMMSIEKHQELLEKAKKEKTTVKLGPYALLQEKISLAQSRGQKDKVSRLSLKAKNIRKDNTCKNALNIVRKAQFIRVGNLNVPVMVKKKTIGLTKEEIDKKNKKARSENKRRKGIEKRKIKEKQEQVSKNTSKETNNKGKLNKSNKKKRKGFGKNLLDQGLGMTKQRLSFICQKTGRSFNLVNERYTTV